MTSPTTAPQLTPTATVWRPGRWSATPIPTPRELHVLTRFGTGYRPSQRAAIRRAGAAGWLDQQLDPGSVQESALGAVTDDWFPDLRRTPTEKLASDRGDGKRNWQYGHDLGNRAMVRQVVSERTLLETMVDFWSNHLHVSTGHDLAFVARMDYDTILRRHALGRFEDLLVEASTSTAMTLFLDNWRSESGRPNENQGRELLEVHTVGAAAGYTEDMVKASARLLSGWTVAWGLGRSNGAYYDPSRHTTGTSTVLGFTHVNDRPDGRTACEAYLRYLARHPATARNLARKIAVRFVSDSPSSEIVTALASTYLSSGTDIAAVLRSLLAHPEFWAARGTKVRTPVEDLVATYRALDVVLRRPRSTESAASTMNWQHGTRSVYSWPRPDGSPEQSAPWASATRMIRSSEMHWNLSGGWWPTLEVSYRAPASWLPARTVRFDQYVDHLCRVMLGRLSAPRHLEAACRATATGSQEAITRDHAIVRWKFPRLVATLLDSPDHMTR